MVTPETMNLAERIFHKKEPVKNTKYTVAPTRETRRRVFPFRKQFAQQLYRKGSPYPNENNWYPIGDPLIEKISVIDDIKKAGAVWRKLGDEEDRKNNRNPIGGSGWIMTWVYRFYGMEAIRLSEKNSIRCKETNTLHQAVRDINAWCEKMENGYTTEQPKSNEERFSELAEIVNTVLDDYPIQGSALKIRKGLVQALTEQGCNENDLREVFPELFSAKHFLGLLRHWSKYGNPFFKVAVKDWSNNDYRFTLQKLQSVLPVSVSG